ncbi:High-affinity zinc uptake system membrane protein ZnuB [bioreactor metagenome]|uniref:High-affinity zinc uptake system membrane protein ZnuB n=1 Tax=bioreactor metagenome TaxID=1076179 RepID=A0A645BN57_9ZZZZ
MLNEFFQYDFIQNAVIVGCIISLICSILGVFVIQRKMSFLGAGLSHSTLGGIGLALLLGIEPLYIALPFTLIVAALITLLDNKTKIEFDTAIGILFSVSTALGIIFISLKDGYVGDTYSYIFGSILAVSNTDILMSVIFIFIFFIILFIFWKEWAYISFDQELAKSDGININISNNILSMLLAVTIVLAIKLIGIVLISAFLILPPATARLYAKTFSQMTILSIIFGLSATLVGLYISFMIDFPSGATIIIIQSIFFATSIIISKLYKSGS